MVSGAADLRSRLDLACEPGAVRHARSHTRDVLREWGVPTEVLYDALTIVAELATNAVRHGGTEPGPRALEGDAMVPPVCALDLRTHNDRLYVAMYDESRRAPVLRPPSDDAENGRGLWLVAGLSDGAWGFVYTTDRPGKLVWARLPLPVAGEPPEPSPADRTAPAQASVGQHPSPAVATAASPQTASDDVAASERIHTENPPAMTPLLVCGETARLPASLIQRAFRLAAPHGTPDDADVDRDLRCHLQVHGAEDHFAHVLNLPGEATGALWTRWADGDAPTALDVLRDCASIDPETREPCCEFADHPGAHSYHLMAAAINPS
ncbi:Anti-sigma regulatory factor (Ser/Thr protein kinase) [Streptomyces sp. DvalAA-14]|uniref:ATP-binding protein n=1 Tax=unclassified Streptomyces TaxID=2593676 RepID=UPI00081B947D|nr:MULTISPECIES: ATP-binding protein [unclassified Streptomyces]MYS23583.1 hypothetical protein [Streptomyces sp. SID4948]SCE35698.1 Anti-sigma regulatory factor (Ser/Thr protein kinase) [Streptomyces sp. DvalAA-14]